LFIIRIKSFAKLKDVIPNLDVHDVDRALAFYVEQLGFEIDFRYERDPKNYAGVRRNDVCLHMQWQHEDEFKKGIAGRPRVRFIVDNPDSRVRGGYSLPKRASILPLEYRGGAEHGSGTQRSETNASEPVLLGRLFISVGRRAAHLANRHLSFAWLAG